MSKTKAILTGVSTLAFLAAAPAFALSVSVEGAHNTAVNVGTGVNVDVGASESARTSSSTTSSSSGATSGTNVSADLSVPLVITQADVSANAWTNVQTAVQANDVRSKTDLSNFIEAKLRSNVDLSSVDTASDHVAVTYDEPARLFGFLPVSAAMTATADASGNVTVAGPWWNFLAVSDEANLQSNVQANVNTVLGATASANAQLSAAQQARLVAAMESAMSASANASASASGSVNTH